MFASLYVKANSRKSVKKYPFHLSSEKCWGQHFVLWLKTNYLEKNAWPPPFFFVDSNSPCTVLLFPHGPNLAQKPSYLVCNVLKILGEILDFKGEHIYAILSSSDADVAVIGISNWSDLITNTVVVPLLMYSTAGVIFSFYFKEWFE